MINDNHVKAPEDKIIVPSSPIRPRPLYNTSSSKQRRKAAASPTITTATTTTTPRGFCRRLSDCIVMGPATSHRFKVEQRAIDQLSHHVGEMETEVEKQKELKSMYKARLEKTQGLLKYCLQVAQDNGFLDVIINKDKTLEFSLSPSTISTTPQPPSPGQSHPDLAPLVNQAKINGWYIEPQEVNIYLLSHQSVVALIL